MVSPTSSRAPSISERSEKNTSCSTLSAARSLRISAIIMVDGALAHERQPVRFRLVRAASAVLGGKRRADRLEIVAGIKALRDRADVLAQRLAVAQVTPSARATSTWAPASLM